MMRGGKLESDGGTAVGATGTATAPGSGGGLEDFRQQLQEASWKWSKFDLDARRAPLDRTAAHMVELRDGSQTARKALGETTRAFKKSVKSVRENGATMEAVEGLAEECRLVVKAYQEEIDSLTRRCKASDAAFQSLYQPLADCPDPAAVLRVAVEHVVAKTEQVTNLLAAMEEMNDESKRLAAEKASAEKDADKLRKDLSAANKEIDGLAVEVEKARAWKKEMAALQPPPAAAAAAASSGGDAPSKAEREELIQLRREVAEYEVEFRSLKNQDITIRKLEAKIADLQQSAQVEIERRVKQAHEQLAETEGRRAEEALEREAALERKLQSLELELRAERAGREATQAHLLEADEGAGEREAAWEAQRQILVDDAERLRQVLHETTRERDELRLSVDALVGRDAGALAARGGAAPSREGAGVTSLGTAAAAVGVNELKAYEAEVSELTANVTALREELKAQEESSAEQIGSMESTIQELEKEKFQLAAAVASLESDIAAAPSRREIEEMRRELRVLKRLEYNVVDADSEKDPEMTTTSTSASGSDGPSTGEEDDLESALVSRLRKLEAELVKERREKVDLANELEKMRHELAALAKAKEEADRLVSVLENDLQTISATPAHSTKTAATTPPTLLAGRTEPDPSTLAQILDPLATPPPPPPPQQSQPEALASSTEKEQDDHSVATIIMAQRDRLRAKCESLEAERDSFKRELQMQVASSESLKADNAKLYEKVRYLQTFSAGSSTLATSHNATFRSASSRDLDLEALESRYEATVDPFRQFGRAERLRKWKEMSPMERVVFVVAKTVLGSKEMRTALFFYVLGMHVLVFVTTYHWSHQSCYDHGQEMLEAMHAIPQLPKDVQVPVAGADAIADEAS